MPKVRNRWLIVFAGLLAAWTAFMVYSMVVFVPSESTLWQLIMRFCLRNRISVFLPAQLFHFSSYAVWATLLLAALTGRYLLRPSDWVVMRWFIPVAGIYAVGPEFLQFLNAARSPSLEDIAVNAAGMLTGVVLIAILSLREGQRCLQQD